MMLCVISYWVLSGAKRRQIQQLRCCVLPAKLLKRRDVYLKLTRHNGRAGAHGTYNPKHNDRSFNLANSEHIDPERAKGNIYWDCFHGFRSALAPPDPDDLAATFSDVERQFYESRYSNFVESQNERNAKIRHTERNRSIPDLLSSRKTCPEETIYQLGTLDEHASAEDLLNIVTEFIDEFKTKFGEHVHVLDWALHLDESTPHIHERHVFDCENRYGEVAPQQEKALEALGFDLPDPDKPLSRRNNRKITFDAACRKMLFEIAKRHGLELEEEAEYGNRKYLEKQDFILAKQKEQLAAQQNKLDELTLKVSDMETLLEKVSAAAYDKAVEVVTDVVRTETRKEDMRMIGATYTTLSDPFYETINDEIQMQIKSNGDLLLVRDPGQDQERQNQEIEDMLNKGIELLIVNPVDYVGVTPALEKAREKGVPVILIDSKVDDPELVTCTITSNNYGAGLLDARHLISQTKSARIVLLSNSDSFSSWDRLSGFCQTLTKSGNDYQILELRDCGGELNRAMRAMVQLLETFPRIDVVMAVNEQAALGAMAALEEKGALSSTLVYSVDGSPEAKALISEGLMTATSAQSPLRIGRMAAEVVYEILEGKPYLTNIVVPVNQITQEDILRYGTEGWQ